MHGWGFSQMVEGRGNRSPLQEGLADQMWRVRHCLSQTPDEKEWTGLLPEPACLRGPVVTSGEPLFPLSFLP